MKSGYTKAYRKELESDIWKMSPLYQRVFYYLRQKATWKPETFPTRLGFGIALNPGQLITSLSSIADGVSWYEYGVKKTPNKKTIKAILDWLESNSMVTVESNRHGTFINIINWISYNSIEMEKVTPSNQPLVTPSKHQLDTLKEVKEVKEKNICPQQAILDLYHTLLPECTHHRVWDKEREKSLTARWNDKIPSMSGKLDSSQIEFWEALFKYIRTLDWLMGKKSWQGFSLFWLVEKKKRVLKVIEGFYENKDNK